MTETEQQQDHPGPDWFLSVTSEDGTCGRFSHPGLGLRISWGDGALFDYEARDEAVARCREISRAALAWERMKLQAAECPMCGALGAQGHSVNCPNNPNIRQ